MFSHWLSPGHSYCLGSLPHCVWVEIDGQEAFIQWLLAVEKPLISSHNWRFIWGPVESSWTFVLTQNPSKSNVVRFEVKNLCHKHSYKHCMGRPAQLTLTAQGWERDATEVHGVAARFRSRKRTGTSCLFFFLNRNWDVVTDSYIWGGWKPQTFAGEFLKYFEKLKEHYDADLDNIKEARFEDSESGRKCIEKTFYEDIEVHILSHFFVEHHLVGDIVAAEDWRLCRSGLITHKPISLS